MTWVPQTTDHSTPAERRAPGRDVMQRIFGAAWTPETASERIETGLPFDALANLAAVLERESVLGALRISRRTFERRRSEGRLKPDESDRLYRLTHLYALAADVLGSAEGAREWLATPAIALGEHTPLEVARNEAGAQRVEDLLLRIEYGVYG